MAWPAATSIFFAYVAAVAWLRPGLHRQKRLTIGLLAAAAAIGSSASGLLPASVLREWIAPPLFLLLAYWTSGLLFVQPMQRAETFLLRLDRRWRVPDIASRLPPAVSAFLELAYAGVYPLIPLAFALYLTCVDRPEPERFWTVVLVTDFICFGMLPWIQTRPPRLLEARPPWRSPLRAFNVRMLGEASIGVNTVPSGHAAEAFAAALLVTGAPWPVTASMWFAALAVSAAAVFGRYHFALDAILGWAVAFGVWKTL
jgi:hypothetical protein